MTDRDDRVFEDLMTAARRDPPAVPPDLMARVLDDAEAAQHLGPLRQGTPLRRGLRGWLPALGGAPGLAGLVAATCVGVWLGLAPPAGVPDLAAVLLDETAAQDAVSATLSGFGWDWGLETEMNLEEG